ncbi:MAG: FAD-containing oxidoreductase [Gemmatimonadaceae bacterium]|nr:FAD-containing oxidoreductase [Gemmatimonadaceae bacterium]
MSELTSIAGDSDRAWRANVSPENWTNPVPRDKYDLVVIGAGTGGLVTSAIAAALGARVALIERHAMGGDCLNVGCVPSKALLRASRAWADARGGRFGAPQAQGDGDFAEAMKHMRRTRAKISAVDSADRYRGMDIDLFFGQAQFKSRDQIAVGDAVLRFRRAVIATGSSPAVPPIAGIHETPFLTNETIFDLQTRPRHLLVVGGGPIGCELAQAFRRLGADVTVLERGERILAKDDADAAAVVARALAVDGVVVRTGVELELVSKRGTDVVVRLSGGEEVRGDSILVAGGRTPNTQGLDLELGEIVFDKKGVTVDQHLRTSNHSVYAVGDVAGSFQFTHVADAHARMVVRNALFFGRQRMDSLVVPWCTYTSPELAHVGMSTDQLANVKGLRSITVPLEQVDRATLEGDSDGFCRLHLVGDKIVAATMVADRAGDIIAIVAAAMTNGLGVSALGKSIFPYPTEAEALRRAADAARRGSLTPGRKRLLSKFFGLFR